MAVAITRSAVVSGAGTSVTLAVPDRVAGDRIQVIVMATTTITPAYAGQTRVVDVPGLSATFEWNVIAPGTGGTVKYNFSASTAFTAWCQIVHGECDEPPPATPVSPWLPFELPAVTSGPAVMPHYFTQFPLRLNATPVPASAAVPGYYYQNYLAPGIVEGQLNHPRYGGFVRDYPVQQGLSSTTSGWEQRDMEREVRDAIAAGFTGFTLDLLSIRGFDGAPDTVGHWTRVKRMVAAVEAVNAADGKNFTLMVMPDGTAGSTAWVKNGTVPDINASADALAQALSQIIGSTSMHKIEGKVVIGPFAPEKWPDGTTGRSTADRVTFWTRLRSTLLNTYGRDVLYWFCYVESWTTLAPTFNGLAYGHGRWGDRDVTAVTGSGTGNRGAADYCHDSFGKPWMHFGGTPMDTRPNAAGNSGSSYRTWESKGTQSLEGSWLAAIDGFAQGDMNQVPTWNDYAEHAHVNRTRNLGYSFLDLSAFFITRYRTGQWPAIVRDALYLSHRIHRRDATLSASTDQVAFATIAGSTGWADLVDVFVFATAAGTVEISCNGTVIATQAVSAGRSHVTCPLPTSGTLSARMVRNSATVAGTAVTSEQPVKATIANDDYHYRSYSSLRQASA